MTSPFLGGEGIRSKKQPESLYKKKDPTGVPHCIGDTECMRPVVKDGMCSRHLVLEGHQ